MSTKTTFKRIALVAVAGLVSGLVSVAPANAAGEELAGSAVSAITASSVTTSPTQGSDVFVKFGASLTALTAAVGTTSDKITFAAALTSVPAGGSVGVTSVLAAGATPAGTATAVAVTAGSAPTLTASSSTNNFTIVLAADDDTAWSAQTKAYLGAFKFSPTKSGAHTITIWNDTDRDGQQDTSEVYQTVTITVAASSGYSAGLSTVYIGTGTTAATVATDAIAVSAPKATGTQAGNIRVAVKNSANAAYAGQTVTFSIAGPGMLGAAATDAAADTANTGASSARVTSVADTNGFASAAIWPDGTSGVGTVTVSITDQVSGATSVLGTKSLTFYGSVAKLEVSASNYTILKATGGVTGGSVTGAVATDFLDLSNRVNATDVPATIIKATDSSGNVVGGLTIKLRATDTTVANSTTSAGADGTNGCKEDVLSAANVYSSGGTGFYNCALSTPSTAVSGGKTVMTFYVLDPADALGVKELTATVDVTIGGSVATETLSFDKASYAPGESMAVTVTAKDKAGNPVYDGAASPAITFSKAVGGTAPAASVYVGGKKTSKANVVFAPAVSGAFSALATSGNAAGTAISAASAVVGAQDALLNSLIKKINALSTLVAKIQKKLGVK